MPLLFEDAGTSKQRKWQCFVCGRNYENYEDYSSHIKDQHEQGREWLECPDCKSPVRDMTMHYKAKHPKRVMPKNIQTRVAVWKDFKPGKDGKDKVTVRKPSPRQGTFTSRKNCRDFVYRSGMEEEFFNLLEADMDVESWAAEPFKIPYHYRGEWHNYIPDIRINYIDGSTEIWEIKPLNQHEYEQNKAKWAAADNYVSNVGWEFIVQSEEGLNKLRMKVTRQKNMLLDQQNPESTD